MYSQKYGWVYLRRNEDFSQKNENALVKCIKRWLNDNHSIGMIKYDDGGIELLHCSPTNNRIFFQQFNYQGLSKGNSDYQAMSKLELIADIWKHTIELRK